MAVSLEPPTEQLDSRPSLALSDTTYHSFHDVEVHEPDATPHPDSWTSRQHYTNHSRHQKGHYDVPVVPEIRRQDSGYESMSVRRDSHSSHRRSSTASATSSNSRQRRSRTSTAARSSKNGPVSQVPRRVHHPSPKMAYSPRQQQQQRPATYFHFPQFITAEPEAIDETEMTVTRTYPTGSTNPEQSQEAPVYPLPPQTTHYWTSDRTRRLEYAAIDAASRGVRGWIRRHVVPECFVPKEKRHLGFEDDRGSVVRYRLELEEDETEKESRHRKRSGSWWFTTRRR